MNRNSPLTSLPSPASIADDPDDSDDELGALIYRSSLAYAKSRASLLAPAAGDEDVESPPKGAADAPAATAISRDHMPSPPDTDRECRALRRRYCQTSESGNKPSSSLGPRKKSRLGESKGKARKKASPPKKHRIKRVRQGGVHDRLRPKKSSQELMAKSDASVKKESPEPAAVLSEKFTTDEISSDVVLSLPPDQLAGWAVRTRKRTYARPGRKANQIDDMYLSPKMGYLLCYHPNLDKSATDLLRSWMLSKQHIEHPYPTKRTYGAMGVATGLEKQQLINWFV